MDPVMRLSQDYPQGICLAALRIAIGVIKGDYLPGTEPFDTLAKHPGVVVLAKEKDDFTAARIAQTKGVRLNDIYGRPLQKKAARFD